ncbi:zeta toxin family protein [Paenibacillus sp. P26]|nr:zeta toxin family protein [Paenibacillus sp. P26]UUZ91839.1 zeta toxin family protein [Paenibacillus sp. P25]
MAVPVNSQQRRGIFLISGIMASGKSTVAQSLAEEMDKSVHVRGDVFRRMIVSGRAEMVPEAPEEALSQLKLRYRLAAGRGGCLF